jgi:NAD(P)-dependent dehydrogenase (short-subunit alcohol dehydrogenase family)
MKRADQVVLVAGSSGGIGDAVVDAFTAEGTLVVGADRGPKEGQELAGFLSPKSSRSARLPISCRTGCASEASSATLSSSHSGTSTRLSTATNSAPGQLFE